MIYLIVTNKDNLPCVEGPGFVEGIICDTEEEAAKMAVAMDIAFEEGKKIKE